MSRSSPIRFVTHGRSVQSMASKCGWRPGARYTNLRDVRHLKFTRRGFLDIDWKNYCFDCHLSAASASKPYITVARDVENIRELDSILAEAECLQQHATYVVIVPKDPRLAGRMELHIPPKYLLGYSCPTKYGGTTIHPSEFSRPVHILGGRPDIQRRLADEMPIHSLDCNRFTVDAAFGKFFDGKRFRHIGRHDYESCIKLSLEGINAIWTGYRRADP